MKIENNKNITLEVILSSIFYDSLKFEITNDDSNEKTTYSLLPNRISFKKTNSLLMIKYLCYENVTPIRLK